MSVLPQHKKSSEELTKLREALGIPALPITQSPPEASPSLLTAHPATALPNLPFPEPAAPTAPALTHEAKPVRSLRKSEQIPRPATPPSAPPADSNLPIQRHSDQELQEIRRREALAMLTPVANPKLAIAHPILISIGYLSALAGAITYTFYHQPLSVSAPCVAAALALATFIFLKKPISRHHAAFIAVIALLVIVFGALHYFPQLRNAT
jgi:hypothetical protein